MIGGNIHGKDLCWCCGPGDAAGVAEAMSQIVQSVAHGEITVSEGIALSGLLDGMRRAIETHDLERRISGIEQSVGSKYA